MEWIRDIANFLLAAMGVYMAIDADWAKKYRRLIFGAFAILMLGSLVAGRLADSVSQDKLAAAQEKLVASQDKVAAAQTELNASNKQVVALLTDNLNLANKVFALQTELAAMAELD